MTLDEKIPIEVWKEIAKSVQLLDFKHYYDHKTYFENLIKLRKYLSKLDICIDTADTVVNPSSLLQAIYAIKVSLPNKKATFYESIYALDELGIQTISFVPEHFPQNMNHKIILQKERDFPQKIEKCYTDGNFTLRNHFSSGYIQEYSMLDIRDANYILQTSKVLSSENIKGHAIIQKFSTSNILPSKKEILSETFPDVIAINDGPLKWGDEPRKKETFETFNKEDSEFIKRLVLKQGSYNQNYYQD